MVELVIKTSSEKDAELIRELMKRFKDVEVNSFAPSLTKKQMQKRIKQGIDDIENGRVKPWSEVKKSLLKRIKSAE